MYRSIRSLAFGLPYILWVQETIDRYADARNLSLVLTFCVLAIGYLLLELLFRGGSGICLTVKVRWMMICPKRQ